MQSNLRFYNFETNTLSDCGAVLEITFSNHDLAWPGILVEQGMSPHFYPTHVYTPYFYFALALENDLHWQAEQDGHLADLHTKAGNIWINPPDTPFTHAISEPCYFVILAIEARQFLDRCPLSLDGIELQFLNNYNVVDGTIKGIIELFMLEVQNKGRNGTAYLDNLVGLLATHYIHNYSNYLDQKTAQVATSKFDQQQIAKIDDYIQAHIGQSIAVDDLADLLGCSKFYFLREFKKHLGITPYQHILDRRLAQAKTALQSGRTNIAATALELGFNDQSHFTRAFKNHFGITPGQFIKQHN
ncbi:helix-turn-helix domain-containing protein [Pseudoalteromonas rubra]|uniref:helix-turn-helix domain-containing protein n=1 Tax=Pseudoalteromonas rubra TaxID=43658 RepID=UPI000F78F259|nr:helix-turn-helix domain-containing protein [Pseudoalteromonas rubra]